MLSHKKLNIAKCLRAKGGAISAVRLANCALNWADVLREFHSRGDSLCFRQGKLRYAEMGRLRVSSLFSFLQRPVSCFLRRS